MTASTTWDKTAADKRAARDALIPKEWLVQVDDDVVDVMDIPAKSGVLSAAELEITETEAPTLVKKMVDKELTSEAVTVAFCKRAAIAQQVTNCLTEIFFEQAITDAKKIDDTYAQTGKPAGPLHGLPVSLKDNFNVKGYDTTVGFISWCNEPAKIDSELAKLLREQGAVLFCKTNVPTAMMIAESYNNVWDYTCSPWNRNTSSGGSSGGEGALLALKGSPLGVGTDIGGSIRIPAALSGVYGLKPSFGRFPTYGARSGMPGQEAVRSINGPMSSSLEACTLFSKTVVDSQPWLRDPLCLPIPWRKIELPQQLVFGILMDNGIVRPTPPVTRALLETKKALEAAGHKVVEWTPYKLDQSKSLIEGFFVGDGGAKISETIAAGPEPWPKGLTTYEAAAEKSKSSPPLVGDLWNLQAERSAYNKGMLDAWNATAEITGTGRPIDGLISPVTAYASCPRYTFAHVTYTSVWNITDQSSAVFPVTRVTEADVRPDNLGDFRNDEEEAVWDSYDPKVVLGAPVGLQVVTRRLEEEKALALAGVAAKALAK